MPRGRKRRTERTETSTDKIISKDVFSSLMKEVSANKAKISEISGHIGSRIKNAADGYNLHRGAFALMVRMKRMDETKRNDLFRNIGLYWDMCVEIGFFGAQTKDMFEDTNEETEDESETETAPELTPDEIAAAANEALLTKGIKELPREGDAELADIVFPPGDPEHAIGDQESDIHVPAEKPRRARKKAAIEGADVAGSYSAVN